MEPLSNNRDYLAKVGLYSMQTFDPNVYNGLNSANRPIVSPDTSYAEGPVFTRQAWEVLTSEKNRRSNRL